MPMNTQSVQPLALFLGDCLRAEGRAPLREKLVIQACPSRSSFHPQPAGNVRGLTVHELVRAVYRRNYDFPHQ